MKLKLKRKTKVILFFFLLICIFLIVRKITHTNQDKLYKLDGFELKEKYDKQNHEYTITLKNDLINYTFKRSSKKIKKNIINKITKKSKEDITCYQINSSYLTFENICYDGKDYISSNVIDDELKKELNIKEKKYKIIEYQKYELYDLMQKNYYVWNYHGFDLISNNKKDQIRLFKNDNYDVSLITNLDEYLFIPDYDNDHYFNKVYIYNMKNDKYKTMDLNKDISFNSEILGSYNKSIYLIDKKNNKEYEFVPHKRKYRKLSNPVYLSENTLVNTNIKSLINKKVVFKKHQLLNYSLKDNYLYMNYEDNQLIKVSNQLVDRIVSVNDLEIYYLVGDTLYYFDPISLETKVLTYTEWNFNKNNPIFIY